MPDSQSQTVITQYYPSVWYRWGASIVDNIVVGLYSILAFLLLSCLMSLCSVNLERTEYLGLWFISYILIHAAYWIYCLFYSKDATSFGQDYLGFKIESVKELSYHRKIAWIAYHTICFIEIIGYINLVSLIYFLCSEKRQTGIDRLLGIQMVNTNKPAVEHRSLIVPTNNARYSILSSYLGLFSVLILPAPFAIWTGILALKDIEKNPEKNGKFRSWFGILAGICSLLVFLLLILVKIAKF